MALCPHGREPLVCLDCTPALPSRLAVPPASGPTPADGLDDTHHSGPRLDEAATLHRAEAGAPGTAEIPDGLSRIGRFVLLEVLGQGGMGRVYSAYDPALDRKVAIKVLRPGPGGSQDSGGTSRLVREAQAMAQLSHPNVVPVYDVGRLGDSIFVAMEYVTGQTLGHWLQARPRTWREVLGMLLAAGRGLEAAHAAGLVHRDFKPANVLVGADGRARVTDFGLARSSRPTNDPEPAPTERPAVSLATPMTMVGAVMGSPGYMAPEQYLGEATSAATDQFAFCVTLYEALYGQRPFTGGDFVTLRTRALSGAVPPPPRGSSVPGWLFPLIERGLKVDPAARHPSMTVLLAALADDPGLRRRRLALGAAFALVITAIVAAAVGGPRLRRATCDAETSRLAEVWSAGAQAQARAAFLATQAPFAQTAFTHARDSLDGFLATWQQTRREACQSALVSRTTSPEQLTLVLECLDRRRAELATLATRFQQADLATVTESAAAVHRLTPVAVCLAPERLARAARLDASARAATGQLELKLAEGRMLVALGRFDEGRARLSEVRQAAHASQDPGLLALAALELGVLERATEHFADARRHFDDAVQGGLAARDDATALHAIALLTSMVGWQLDAPKEAMALVTVGRGLSTRVRAPLLEALLDEGAGDAWWRAGDNGQALAAYERALAGLIAIQGPTGLDVARLHSSIGWIQMERGALAEAAKAYEASRAIRVALLGSSHPQLSATFNELGHLEEGQWHLEAALASFDACRAIHLANKGPRSLGVVRTEFNRARVLVELGRVDEAAAALAVGEAVLPTMAEVSPSTRAELEQGQARLALVRGQLDQAITLARMALASNEASSGPGHPFAAAVTVVLAQALLEKGRSVEAREVLRRSVAHQEARGELVSSEALRTRVLLARAERLAGDAAGARGTGEETIGRLPRVAGNERFKAEAWLELAEAHLASHTPRERALEAARAARDVAHAAGLSAPQQQAERFLASHASP